MESGSRRPMVPTTVHSSWRTFLRAGRPDRRPRSVLDSRRGVRSGGLEVLEARMLLSLGGASTSDVEQPIGDFARASAQVSAGTAESEPPTSVTVSLLPPIGDPEALASPRQFAGNDAVGFSI